MAPPQNEIEHRHLSWVLRDCARSNKQARRLLDEFGLFAAVLSGGAARQYRVTGDMAVVRSLASFRRAALHASITAAARGPILTYWSDLIAYLRLELAHEIHEHFHTFFLNTRYELICGERLASGSIADCQVVSRVIIARALELGASAIVLAHNHPSGDLTPSSADRSFTKEVKDIARRLEIAVLDHIIVSREGFVSLRKLLLM